MENNNWRPTQGESNMEGVDWRTLLPPDSRQRIVNKIMETLKRHLPIFGSEGIHELKKIAVRFEEKIYSAATSQSDYLRRISVKMLAMETKSQSTCVPDSLPSNSAVSNQKPDEIADCLLPDITNEAPSGMQSQVPNQEQQPIPLPNQAQAWEPLLSQNFQNSGVPLPSFGQSSNSRFQQKQQQRLQRLWKQKLQQKNIQSSLLQLHKQQNLLQQTQLQQNQQLGQQNNVPYILQHQQQLLGHQNNISNLHQQQFVPQNIVAGLQQQQQGMQTSSSLLQIPGQQSQPSEPNGMQSQVPNQGQQPIPLSNIAQAWQPLLSQNIQNSGVQSSTSLPSALPSVGQSSNLKYQQQQQKLQQILKQKLQQWNIQPSLLQLHMQQNLLQPTHLQQNQLLGQQNNDPYILQHQQQLLGHPNISNLHQQQFVPQQQLLGSQLGVSNIQQPHPSGQTNHANVSDWQEELYQKLQSMKEMYLPDLTKMHEKITIKCQQMDPLPQPSEEQIDKLKIMKMMLERFITFLQVSKNNIPPGFREKLGKYEKLIICFLNTQSPKKIIQANMMDSLKPTLTLESGQAPISVEQSGVRSIQQNALSVPQPANITFSQCGVNGFLPNMNPSKVNPNVLQHQNLKQPLLQSQEMKQMASPSIPLAPSPISGDLEKQTLSNAGNVGWPKKTSVVMAPSPLVLFLLFFGIIAWRFLCCGDT